MSEDNKPVDGAPEGQADDKYKNLKAEMDRKLDNITQQLSQSNQSVQAMMEQALAQLSQRSQQPAANAPTRKLSDLILEDPDAAEREIENRINTRVNQAVNQVTESSSKTNNAIVQLQNDYPELRDTNSELSQKAIAIYNNLPKHLVGTPEGTRYAIREAAAELAVIPASKRKKSADAGDDFVAAGNTGSGSRKPSKKEAEASEGTLALLKLMGKDPNDPKVKKHLEQAVKRDTYGKYRG